MSEYPEHEKLRKSAVEALSVLEFLEWLEKKQWDICETRDDGWTTRFHLVELSSDEILAEFIGIDRSEFIREEKIMSGEPVSPSNRAKAIEAIHQMFGGDFKAFVEKVNKP